jgi:hypothetical protein
MMSRLISVEGLEQPPMKNEISKKTNNLLLICKVRKSKFSRFVELSNLVNDGMFILGHVGLFPGDELPHRYR